MIESEPSQRSRTVAITGAGSGIGRELTLYFATHGWNVCMVDIDDAALNEAARHVNSLYTKTLAITADIRDPIAMERAFKSCLERFGALDSLVNNAGITDKKHRRLLDVPYEVWKEILSVNVTGTFIALTTFAKLIVNRCSGNIVNVSSLLGQPGQTKLGDTPYGVSKAAVEGLTRYAAAELSSFGININSVYPAAMVNTSFFDYLPPGKRATLKPASLLNEPVYFLSSLQPGELTGVSVNAQTWRDDPTLSAIGDKYINR